MNDLTYYKQTNKVKYLDYSDFLGIPCGMVIQYNDLTKEQIPEYIIREILGKNDDSCRAVTLNQKHTNIIIASNEDTSKPTDGVYTSNKGELLTIRTADCFPVTLYDGTTLGIIHAGWRGAFQGIIKEFFHIVPEFDTAKAKAILSPGIGECCFEVSPEVAILFEKKYRRFENDRYFVDIRRLILDELALYGVKSTLDNSVCTYCNSDLFYSYRREGNIVKQMISYVCAGG